MKNWLKEKRAKLELFMLQENAGMGTVEVILLIVDNPFTSSTYILSY